MVSGSYRKNPFINPALLRQGGVTFMVKLPRYLIYLRQVTNFTTPYTIPFGLLIRVTTFKQSKKAEPC